MVFARVEICYGQERLPKEVTFKLGPVCRWMGKVLSMVKPIIRLHTHYVLTLPSSFTLFTVRTVHSSIQGRGSSFGHLRVTLWGS